MIINVFFRWLRKARQLFGTSSQGPVEIFTSPISLFRCPWRQHTTPEDRMFERLRGHGIKTRLLNPYDAFWDWKLGVHTFGYHPASGKQGDSDWQLHYTPTPYADIFRLLRMVELGPDDVFVDLGGGL